MAEAIAGPGGEGSELLLSSGDRVHVRALRGVVADDQHSADTRFYSVGGGGYVGPHGGSVAAPEIRSVTDQHQTIWLTDSGGRDHSLDFTNVSIPLRVGQRISAVYCRFDGTSTERCEYLVNHSAGVHRNLAREFRPIVDFESRYGMGPVMALLLYSLFLGSMLIWLKPFQPAFDSDYTQVRPASFCGRLAPRDPRAAARVREQLALQYEKCEQGLQQAAEARRSAWHAWWVPASCAAMWIFLRSRNASRKEACGRHLRAEYLAALDRWAATA